MEADAAILESFQADKGETIPLRVGGKKHRVVIVAIRDGKIRAAKKVKDKIMGRDLAPQDLDHAEKAGRLDEIGQTAKGLYLAAGCYTEKQFEAAERHLRQTGVFAAPLRRHVKRAQRRHVAMQERRRRRVIQPAVVTAAKVEGPQPEVEKEKATEKQEEDTPHPRHIRLSAIVHRETQDAGGCDYDNQRQDIEARIHVKNRSRCDIRDFKARLIIIGQSTKRKDRYRIFKILDTPVNVESWRNFTSREIAFTIFFDDNRYAQFGYEYDRYAVALFDDEGHLVKASCPGAHLDDP